MLSRYVIILAMSNCLLFLYYVDFLREFIGQWSPPSRDLLSKRLLIWEPLPCGDPQPPLAAWLEFQLVRLGTSRPFFDLLLFPSTSQKYGNMIDPFITGTHFYNDFFVCLDGIIDIKKSLWGSVSVLF